MVAEGGVVEEVGACGRVGLVSGGVACFWGFSFILFHFILSYFMSFYFTYSVLFYSILFYLILYSFVSSPDSLVAFPWVRGPT